eukprot:NODE_2460_length_692_cov_45.227061_g2009_i0.p5 GENE.NODE_2460_length_692_cov_45.227061_g2009_i0~~NODE_2460_length_692_cov_45.227061_g2009_i0.p5  ORF type:complete len:53 (+),score=8.32 NODE_2460_length_692_cov_45.227061_g2009_i0:140-298(+)
MVQSSYTPLTILTHASRSSSIPHTLRAQSLTPWARCACKEAAGNEETRQSNV